MLRWPALLLLVVGLAACGGRTDPSATSTPTATATATGTAAPAGNPVQPRTAAQHLRALQEIADANDGTRAAGTPGDRASQDYVAGRLRDAGWMVGFETVRFPFFEERSPGRLTGAREGRDFAVLAYSGSGRVSARTSRARGLGCDAADWRGVRAGTVAVVERGTCTFGAKAAFAEQREAAALVVITGDGRDDAPTGLRGGTLGEPGTSIPALLVQPATGEQVLRRGRATLRVDAVSEERSTRNVIALKPGRGRIVSAGAHLDSVDEGPGANDNASGSAALLAAAERLGDTRRPVQLGFWGAEELGLLGSRAHVEDLTAAERRRIAVHVNLDMVGTPDGTPLVASPDSDLRGVLGRALRSEGERPRLSTSLNGSSDHASFARAGIPSAFVYTGQDDCYHQACDTADKVDDELMQRVSDATRRTLQRLAER